MSGPKRNPDRLNTIGVVVVGICGAVLVYVTIVALEAFYVNDTSEIQTMADYGGQDTTARSLRTEQVNRISEYGTNPRPAAAKANEPEKPQTFRVPINVAMKLVVESAKTDPSLLVPSVGRSDKSTVLPIFGRPKLAPAPAPGTPAPGAPAPGTAAPVTSPAPTPAAGTPPPGTPAPGTPPPGTPPPAGSAAGTPAASGPAAGSAAVVPSAPLVPTGAGTQPSPVGGAGPLDKPSTPATPRNPEGPADKAPAPPPPRSKGNGQ